MDDAWIKALTFAALPRAKTVEFSRSVGMYSGLTDIRYRLTSLDGEGNTIGDDRDYDLLKAAMGPLERLAENVVSEDFQISLNLNSGKLERS
ncbi:MAG: hypothetical protein AAFX02_01185 [Pseudomonadota bacterium]